MKIAIIGTGFSGLCMAIKLKEAGFENITLFEKAASLGGTWRENTYPGAECDVPSHMYSYSFEPNPNWSNKWSHQDEILAYMQHCANKYGIMPHIRFNSEIAAARFNEAESLWQIEIVGGEQLDFNFLVSGVGQLNRPFTPAIKGLDDFAGTAFHSAEWRHDIDLGGKDVVVIGNAASAIQFIPQIAPAVNRLTIFQRSANWMLRKNDRAYFAWEKWLFAHVSPLRRLHRLSYWLRGELLFFPIMLSNKWYTQLWAGLTKKYIRDTIDDTELQKRLLPDYPIGAKRVLFSDDYYASLNRANVATISTSIDHVTSDGVVTKDGDTVMADIIIFGTGFQSSAFLAPIKIEGREGSVLDDEWKTGAEGYLGISVAGFPNLFLLYGPNTNLGHNSIIHMIESQVRYIVDAVEKMVRDDIQAVEVRADVQADYNRQLQQRLAKMAWAKVDHSWYMRDHKIINNWAGTTLEYRFKTRRCDLGKYRCLASNAVTAAAMVADSTI